MDARTIKKAGKKRITTKSTKPSQSSQPTPSQSSPGNGALPSPSRSPSPLPLPLPDVPSLSNLSDASSFFQSYFEIYCRHKRPLIAPEVWSVREMSNWLGYSERSIEKMINNHSDFPEPVISGPDLEDARWFAHEVLTWIQQPSSKPLKIR